MNNSDSVHVAPFAGNEGLVHELYEQYCISPNLVSAEWQAFFAHNWGTLPNGQAQRISPTSGANGHHECNGTKVASGSARSGANNGSSTNGAHLASPLTASIELSSSETPPPEESSIEAVNYSNGILPTQALSLTQKVASLIGDFRNYGHLSAKVNPITAGVVQPTNPSQLSLDDFPIEERKTPLKSIKFANLENPNVESLFAELQKTYCSSIGFEFKHLDNYEERTWLLNHIEGDFFNSPISEEKRKFWLKKTLHSCWFEELLHRKYVGVKRFSGEGNDSLIPCLIALVEEGKKLGVREGIIGLAHRGRLSVITNVLGRSLTELFQEFDDTTISASLGAGDVKYHLGFRGNVELSSGGHFQLEMAPNPSHLEFVGPVVNGKARALQDNHYQRNRGLVLPILLHGDAAMPGQGIVAESFNFANIRGYRCGGSVHIVVNNQVGFTATPDESRSGTYCTDFAKGMEIPVFHVNAEDVEAVCRVAELAMQFRQKFKKDVIIDLIGYRKHGHNEGDDPTYTQPIMYHEIKGKPSIGETYKQKLVKEGIVSEGEIEAFQQDYKARFDRAHQEAKTRQSPSSNNICSIIGRKFKRAERQDISQEEILEIVRSSIRYPDGFAVHPKLQRMLEKRVEGFEQGEHIEWGLAELLAYATLKRDGYNIRISGQDSIRGTFSHRHLGLDDLNGSGQFFPLSQGNGDGQFKIYNSPLSENGILAFEYGYATESNGLTIWEAQFGDFVNGAQVIIDQFISSSEVKWGELSGIVMMLPHGMEGAGPEHSSARPERFLQLCSDNNMRVAYPTTTGQIFHLLREQGYSSPKRPLIILTPKSLLRAPFAMTSQEEFFSSSYQPAIVDEILLTGNRGGAKKNVIVACTGKVYYDIVDTVKKIDDIRRHVKIIRFEDMYPLNLEELREKLAFPQESNRLETKVIWAQEEHQNQGFWSYMRDILEEITGLAPTYVGRPKYASTATGSPRYHVIEKDNFLAELVDKISQ